MELESGAPASQSGQGWELVQASQVMLLMGAKIGEPGWVGALASCTGLPAVERTPWSSVFPSLKQAS